MQKTHCKEQNWKIIDKTVYNLYLDQALQNLRTYEDRLSQIGFFCHI